MNPDEIATMTVAGRRFDNWESVWIQHRWTENYPLFRFTTADIAEVDGAPPPDNWRLLQIKPGDDATISLGNNLAVTGVIYMRQTAYDKQNKGVMLQGVGVQFYAARASVIHKTGNFDGKNLQQVANEVGLPTGIAFLPVGNLDPTPFKQLQVQPGEPIGHFIERLARPRGAILGSDHEGHLLLIGSHSNAVIATLQEGVNILKCQALIDEQNIYSEYIVHGQTGASNDQSGIKSSEQDASAAGTAKRYSPQLTPAEQPVWSIAELQTRAANEAKWHEGTIIRVNITVQGWMIPGTHTIWQAGSNVRVISPMAMLNNIMSIQTATFTQDRNSGTLTELELVPTWALNDGNDFDLRNPNGFPPPGPATINTGPAVTPPAAPPQPVPPVRAGPG